MSGISNISSSGGSAEISKTSYANKGNQATAANNLPKQN